MMEKTNLKTSDWKLMSDSVKMKDFSTKMRVNLLSRKAIKLYLYLYREICLIDMQTLTNWWSNAIDY